MSFDIVDELHHPLGIGIGESANPSIKSFFRSGSSNEHEQSTPFRGNYNKKAGGTRGIYGA
jgi:hypothetical protein